jgi:ribA/ribD-fused uncharacterized protein
MIELFGDNEVQAEIMASKNQKEIKDLGRKVRNFDGVIWDKNKKSIVFDGNLAKFSQNEKLKFMLLSTGDKILVEASPYDKIWGIGIGPDDPNKNDMSKWQGENLLGQIWSEIRKELDENK